MINIPQLKIDCEKESIIYREYIIIDGQTIDIKGKLFRTAYKDTHWIGTFNAGYLKFIAENNIQYRNKEFDYYKQVNETSFKVGHFIVTDIKDNDTTEEVEVTAYDNAIKFATTYKTDLDYRTMEVTLFEVLQECCAKCGVGLENSSIINGDFVVDSNQFPENTMFGDVISAIAFISGTFATINSNGNLELIMYKESFGDEKIIEDYTSLEDKRDTRPITCVALGVSDIEGENVVLKDDELIEEYGENWLIINDNPFAYTQSKRAQLIQPIFNNLKGFGYSAFVTKDSFKPYYELGDMIKFRNKNGDLVTSVVYRMETDYDSVTLSAPSVTDASIEYEQPLSAIELSKRTEIIVDKANSKINQVISEIGDRSQKTTTITQDLDGINAKVDNIIDFTREQTTINQLHLEDTAEGNEFIFVLKIKGNTAIWQYLTPSETLTPSQSLVPLGDSVTIVCDTQDRYHPTTNAVEYKIVVPEPLRHFLNVYDELIIEKTKVSIIRRIGVDIQGQLYVLAEETVETLPDIKIKTFKDDTYIYIKEYESLDYYCKYVIDSDYSEFFATQQGLDEAVVELNSEISQTAEEINLEVSKKVGNDEVISRINQSAEQIQINANKISLERKRNKINSR